MDHDLFEQAFVHARLKVDRANRHIDEAQHWFRVFAESDFYQISQNTNSQSGNVEFRIQTEGIPPALALAVGDVFHCLSAALDYVVSGLMNAKTGNTTRVHFPAHETRKGLRKSFMAPKSGDRAPPNRRIVKAFPLIALELLTVIKPYRGGNFALWEIRKADNIDKHNLIIPSVTIAEIHGIDFVDKVHGHAWSGFRLAMQAGRIWSPVAFAPDAQLEFQNQGQATTRISFPDDMEVFAGKPVFPTLLECSQFVAEALDRMEAVARRYL